MLTKKNFTSINTFIKEKITFIKEKDLHLYIGAGLLVLYTILGYKNPIIRWYNKHVIDEFLCKIESNIALQSLGVLLISISIYDLIQKYKNRYRFDSRLIFLVVLLSTIIFICRLSGLYDYLSFLGFISYVDVMLLIGTSYVMVYIVNVCLERKEENNNIYSQYLDGILHDCPITKEDDDIFNLKDEIKKIVSIIKDSDKNKTWSLAITAQWGIGKTSFINCIVNQLEKEKDKIEVLVFNPRTSKSVTTIQEDFFTQFTCILSKYNSRCSHVIKDYMSALQLIDNRGLVEKAIHFYQVWNKVDLKESIKKTLKLIPKKVLVVIDDFDRLSKDEILEVLKLIDSNAAFPNIFFLTAYDKKQVNKYFGDKGNTEDACFVDKFFNLEFAIPLRPYTYISRFIEGELNKKFPANDNQEIQFNGIVTSFQNLFRQYVPTLRDAKRYINQFALDYREVEGDVVLQEFILVQLIKYRFPEEYNQLYKTAYIEEKKLIAPGIFVQKESIPEDTKSLSILQELFPKAQESVKDRYRHIYSIKSFQNYFINQIIGTLRIREMNKVFTENINDAYKLIDHWLKDKESTNSIIDYLDNTPIGKTTIYYIPYCQIVTYIMAKRHDGTIWRLFLNLIQEQEVVTYLAKDKVERLKEVILNIITSKKYDDYLVLARKLHSRYMTGDLSDKEYLIKDSDIWKTIKKEFIEYTRSSTKDDAKLQEWLYNCIDHKDTSSNKFCFDADCLDTYREYIENSPNYYIQNFVRLAYISSDLQSNSIACEPLWQQIFGDQEHFEAFIERCEEQNVPGIQRVKNFWRLYKANDMNPIEFEAQGNVQEKIDSDLTDEIKKLEQLEEIEKEIDKISLPNQKFAVESKEEILTSLNDFKSRLNEISLYIRLNGRIKNKIDSLIEKYQVYRLPPQPYGSY